MRKLLSILLAVVGVALVVVAVVYFAEPAHSLPAFFPGHAVHARGGHKHGIKHGVAALVVGLIAAGVGLVAWPRQRTPTARQLRY